MENDKSKDKSIAELLKESGVDKEFLITMLKDVIENSKNEVARIQAIKVIQNLLGVGQKGEEKHGTIIVKVLESVIPNNIPKKIKLDPDPKEQKKINQPKI